MHGNDDLHHLLSRRRSSRPGCRFRSRTKTVLDSREKLMLDLTKARIVEVVWDPNSRRLWINTEDGCVGRIYNVEEFHYRETPADLED
jgi:hypothetical protein